jgi:hypothetical protein
MVAVGVAVTVMDVLSFKVDVGDHSYEAIPEPSAVNCTLLPKHK